MKYQLKPLFEQRIKALLNEEEDFKEFLKYIEMPLQKSIRCNTLKIQPEQLKSRIESRGWQIIQPFPEHKEIMIIKSKLEPGELGKSLEHIMGYYYVQEIASMMPILALNPQKNELILDLCASPGSKTTQIATAMQNTGTIIANDNKIDRIAILASNLEKCGCTNTIVTRNDGVQLCEKLAKSGIRFDKILVDAPCSGEGNIKSNPKTLLMWNIKMIEKLSRIQKKLASSALNILKDDGEMIYSTCTHAPEENEVVIDYLIKNCNVKIEKISLPLKCRQGITQWKDEKFDEQIKNACRIYPQDNNTEGFFLCKIKKEEK